MDTFGAGVGCAGCSVVFQDWGIDAARAAVSPVTALATLISLPTPARD